MVQGMSRWREVLHRITDPGSSADEDIELVKIFQLTTIFGFIGFLFLVLFGASTVLAGNRTLGIFDITMGGLSLLNILLLRRRRGNFYFRQRVRKMVPEGFFCGIIRIIHRQGGLP